MAVGDNPNGAKASLNAVMASKLTGLDRLVGFDSQDGAIRYFVTFALATMFVVNDDFAGAGNHHQFALAVSHVTHGGVKADAAIGLGFHAGCDRCTRSGATDVEGTHGQLGT